MSGFDKRTATLLQVLSLELSIDDCWVYLYVRVSSLCFWRLCPSICLLSHFSPPIYTTPNSQFIYSIHAIANAVNPNLRYMRIIVFFKEDIVSHVQEHHSNKITHTQNVNKIVDQVSNNYCVQCSDSFLLINGQCEGESLGADMLGDEYVCDEGGSIRLDDHHQGFKCVAGSFKNENILPHTNNCLCLQQYRLMHTGRLALNFILLFVLVCGQNEVLWCVCMRGVFVVEKNMCMMWGLFFEWSIMWILSLFGTVGAGILSNGTTTQFEAVQPIQPEQFTHTMGKDAKPIASKVVFSSQNRIKVFSEYCLLQPINQIVIILEQLSNPILIYFYIDLLVALLWCLVIYRRKTSHLLQETI